MPEVNHTPTYREQLRERILEVSMQAFATHGVRAVKMDDIAQMLGISKRTLYEVYENKESVLRAGVEKYRQQNEEEIRAMDRLSKNVIELILMMYEKKVDEWKKTSPQFYTDIGKYPQIVQLLHSNHEKSYQYLLEFLRRGVKEQLFRNDIDMELLAQSFQALSEYMMQQHLYEQYSVEHIYRNLVLVIIRGACTTRGVQMIDKLFASKKPATSL